MADEKGSMIPERGEKPRSPIMEQPTEEAAETRTTASLCRLHKTISSTFAKPKGPVVEQRKTLPEISLSRREASLTEHAFSSEADVLTAGAKEKTVLYLAYGSNLCYATFQGQRGVRPISQMNVIVPELRLTFDLPGIAYTEPCFANSALRDTSGSAGSSKEADSNDYHKDRWKKGMIGVVYEVTMADYVHIIATEGGGSSYHDILVTCYPVSSSEAVPDVPKTAPFKTHTLFAPAIPPPEPGKPRPAGRFQRPDPSYAQASARYLNLITTGADENNLPQEYKDYLRGIRPYEITSQGQRLGQFVFLTLWTPFIILIFSLQRTYQDDRGRAPKWLARLSTAIFAAVWTSYDNFFRPTFGDGERTTYGKKKSRYRKDKHSWRGRKDEE